MGLQQIFIESWRRQCTCLENLMGLLDDALLQAKPSEDGWTVAYHLCHVHQCRVYWLSLASDRKNPELVDLYMDVDGDRQPNADLKQIREQLAFSSQAISAWLEESLTDDAPAAGPYDHPAFFLQHMIWHEGYHFGLLMLALRLAGHEPNEEWEDPNVWGLWRNWG